MKKSIFDGEEYYKIFEFILLKENSARSYQITKEFGITTKERNIQNDEIKIMRRNISKKLQTMKKHGLIKVIKSGFRGWHGRYSVYDVDKLNFTLLFLFEYIKSSKYLEQFSYYIADLKPVQNSIYKHLIEIVKIIQHRKKIGIIEKKTLRKLFFSLESFFSIRGLINFVKPKDRKEVEKTFIYYQEEQMKHRLSLIKKEENFIFIEILSKNF